ncbi:MAG TPA: MFS transporter [Anaerolineales bacterium]|nr:MFS transporter [Anaerolineales bacterium]
MNLDLLLVILSLLTWGIGEGMFLSFEPLYLQELGADPVRIGAILGALGLAMAAAQAPAGYLADRFGRKPVMVSAWFLGVASTGIMALATSLPFFVVGLLLYGLTAWVVTPLNSYVTSARGKLSVGRVLTLVSATYHAGAILGPLIGGWIGETWGLRYTFVVAAGGFVVSTVLVVFIRPQAVEHAAPGERRWDLFKNTHFLQFLGMVLMVMVALYIPQPLSPNFLQNERGLSVGTIGQLVSVGSVGIVSLNLILGQFPARIGAVLGQIAVAGFALFLWRGTGFYWFAVGYFMLGGFRVTVNLLNAEVRELVSPSNMGLAFGMVATVGLLATVIAPPIAGVLYERNPVWMYPVAVGLIGVCALLSGQFLRRIQMTSDVKPGEVLEVDR